MSSTNSAAAAYPAPASSAAQGPYHVQPPPPAGYAVPVGTKSKCDGFWKCICVAFHCFGMLADDCF